MASFLSKDKHGIHSIHRKRPKLPGTAAGTPPMLSRKEWNVLHSIFYLGSFLARFEIHLFINPMIKKRIQKLKHFIDSGFSREEVLKGLASSSLRSEQSVYSAYRRIRKRGGLDQIPGINALREYEATLKLNNTMIKLDPIHPGRSSDIATIYQHAASKPFWAGFYYWIARQFKSQSILELGTNLGVSGQYFYHALADNSIARFVSLEGIPALQECARHRLEGMTHVQASYHLYTGFYSELLPQVLPEHPAYDLVFIDGHHQYQPTLDYFWQIKPYLADDAILLFDDINWNSGMQQAWLELQKVPHTIAIDFFKMGVLIYSPTQIPFNKSYSLFLSF